MSEETKVYGMFRLSKCNRNTLEKAYKDSKAQAEYWKKKYFELKKSKGL